MGESSSFAPPPEDMSEEEYNALLEAEFEAEFKDFTFDPAGVEEWSDELEREKQQAKMDAHFTYCAGAFAVPVSMLSACLPDNFSTTSRDPYSPNSDSSTDASLASSSLEYVMGFVESEATKMLLVTDIVYTCLMGLSDFAGLGTPTPSLRRFTEINKDIRKKFASLEPQACTASS